MRSWEAMTQRSPTLRAGADRDRRRRRRHGSGSDRRCWSRRRASRARRGSGRSARRAPAARRPATVRRPRARGGRGRGAASPPRSPRSAAMGGLSRSERLVIAGIFAATALAGHRALRRLRPPLLAFAIATVALAGLAHVVSLATEQVGSASGPASPACCSRRSATCPSSSSSSSPCTPGEVVVAQTSIIGSLFANALLVLGLRHRRRRAPLGRTASCASARDCRTTPRRCCSSPSFIIVRRRALARHARPRRAPRTDDLGGRRGRAAGRLPRLGRALPARRARRPSAAPRAGRASRSPSRSACWRAGGVGSAFVSDWFVAALRPTIDQLGISEAFAGWSIVAIAGNAVENVAGIVLAHKGQVDLAISVVKNSVAQIAAFLYPLLVLVSLLFATPSHLRAGAGATSARCC